MPDAVDNMRRKFDQLHTVFEKIELVMQNFPRVSQAFAAAA
jgi:hypothetical protein